MRWRFQFCERSLHVRFESLTLCHERRVRAGQLSFQSHQAELGELDEVLIRLDPYIPIGFPISHRFAVPVPHYERLSVILKGMSYEEAKSRYPEIGRLLENLGTAGDAGSSTRR